MKTNFLFLLLCFSLSAFAQEQVSFTSEYVAYQDSLFILKTTTITNQGIEGINDTLVEYVPPAVDTAGLIGLISVNAVNASNSAAAKMRRAFVYRRANATAAQYSSLLENLDADLDSIYVALYANALSGRYRIITDTTNFLVDIATHPNRADLLRATEVDNPTERYNIIVRGRWEFQINALSGENVVVLWDGDNSQRPLFRSPTFALPNSITSPNTIRVVKTN